MSSKNLNKPNKEMILLSQRINEETSNLIKDFDYIDEYRDEMKLSSNKLDASPMSGKKMLERRSVSIRNL